MAVKIDTDARIAKIRVQEQGSDPSPSAGYGFVYEKTDGNMYFINASGTVNALNFLTPTNLGYTSIGGTSDAFTSSKYIAKPVTPINTRPIRGIAMRIAGNGSNDIQPMCAIYDDNTGAPGKCVAYGGMTALAYGLILSSTARWLYMPIYYVPVANTQIWIVGGSIRDAANEVVFYYDAGGGDYALSGATTLTDGGFSTTSGRRYSLYAVQE